MTDKSLILMSAEEVILMGEVMFVLYCIVLYVCVIWHA